MSNQTDNLAKNVKINSATAGADATAVKAIMVNVPNVGQVIVMSDTEEALECAYDCLREPTEQALNMDLAEDFVVVPASSIDVT